MTLLTPRLLPTKSYAFSEWRDLVAGVLTQEGIVDAGDFAVSQRGAGANMSVDVAAGAAFVQGDDATRQGIYEVVNDATINVAIAANASGNPRIDAIVLQVNDSSVTGATDVPAVSALAGTPTAGATLANLLGKPSIPNTCLLLRYVVVANGAVSIVNANIGGLVDPTVPTLGAVAGAPTQYALGKPRRYTPAARAYHSVDQNVTTGGTLTVLMNSERHDTEAIHDLVTANNRLTCRTPGVYLMAACHRWASTSFAGRRIIGILVNGGEIARDDRPSTAAGATGATVSTNTQYRLGYGDYVETTAFQDSGVTVAVLAVAPVSPELSMVWDGN
jgi:hypothetical protein